MRAACWLDIDIELNEAVRHFQCSIELYERGGFGAPGLDGYQAKMALMHAMQVAHTSLERGLLRILDLLGEERPCGEDWPARLIKRAASELPGRRPAILEPDLARAATETLWRRREAMQDYESFDLRGMEHTIAAARIIVQRLMGNIAVFKSKLGAGLRK